MADHETGGLSLGRNVNGRGIYDWHPEVLARVQASYERLIPALRRSERPDSLLQAWLGLDSLRADEQALVAQAMAELDTWAEVVTELIGRRAVVAGPQMATPPWTSTCMPSGPAPNGWWAASRMTKSAAYWPNSWASICNPDRNAPAGGSRRRKPLRGCSSTPFRSSSSIPRRRAPGLPIGSSSWRLCVCRRPDRRSLRHAHQPRPLGTSLHHAPDRYHHGYAGGQAFGRRGATGLSGLSGRRRAGGAQPGLRP